MSTFGLDHLSPLTPEDTTGGPTIGMWDSITQSFESQFRVHSPLSRQQEVQNAWLENLSQLERITGEKFEMPRTGPYEDASLGALGAYLETVETGSTSY